MPQTLRKDESYKSNYEYHHIYSYVDAPIRKRRPKTTKNKLQKSKKYKKRNFFATIISLTTFSLIAYFIMPFTFLRVSLPIFTGKQNYSNIKTNYYKMLFPTTNYLSNTIFEGKRELVPAVSHKPLMTNLYITEKMSILESGLKDLMVKYPSINPAITVWDFDTGKYVDIKGDETYPAASIIKIPVLINLFKSIERDEISVYDNMVLTDYYKASGSGNLQYAQAGRKYTLDELAKTMIEDSDNSATNMLMSKTGSMTSVNSAIRSWGIGRTYVQTWLPDLTGTNYTTTNDIAKMLFNIDNPTFLSINSREKIIGYMSHVKNDRLIPQGLGKGATFIHKTGDIGTMLGDAGIVYMPNGKKYIVVIMAKRPHNSPLGKEFIQKASKIIYDYMQNL